MKCRTVLLPLLNPGLASLLQLVKAIALLLVRNLLILARFPLLSFPVEDPACVPQNLCICSSPCCSSISDPLSDQGKRLLLTSPFVKQCLAGPVLVFPYSSDRSAFRVALRSEDQDYHVLRRAGDFVFTGDFINIMDGNFSESVSGDYHLATIEERLKSESFLASNANNNCDNCKHLMHNTSASLSSSAYSAPTCLLNSSHGCQRTVSTPRQDKRCCTACMVETTYVTRRVFGVELSQQLVCDSHDAPPLLARCVDEIEKRGGTHVDLNKVFSLKTSVEVIRTVTDQISLTGDLNILAACEISCVVELFKRYLYELPTPVIPSSMYDMFIEATRSCETDEQRISIILDLAKKLPDAHAKTLKFLMCHFSRLCSMITQSGKRCCPVTLLQPLAVGLIRPQWHKTELIAQHIFYYNNILEILLLKGGWGGVDLADLDYVPTSRDPSVPSEFVRRNSFGAKCVASPANLDECEWFWGPVTREDAAAAMKDQPDGAFLVRASSSKVQGEYTLTLRKDGTNKLIRIIGHEGRFGFAEPLEFDSLQAVIDHHRTTSLALYNRQLDICLISPVSKSQNVIDSTDRDKVLQQLREHNTEYNMWSEIYDRLAEETSRSNQEVNMKMQAMEAFDAAVSMFEEQMKIHERFQANAKPNELEAVKANYGLLKTRLDGIVSSRAKLQVDLNLQTQWLRAKENDLGSIKPRITHLNIVRNDMIKLLTRNGVSPRDLDVILQESAKIGERKGSERLQMKNLTLTETIYEETAPVQKRPFDESTWYIPAATRESAEAMLANKPAGTFLIRRRTEGSTGQTHALSVVVDGKIGHCLINQNDNAFGFAAPSSEYPALRDLVIHYSKKSLQEHNPNLNVSLAFPVNASS